MLFLPNPSSHSRKRPAGAAMRPELTSRICSCVGARILVFDDCGDLPFGIAHDASIAVRFVEIDRQDGERARVRRRRSVSQEKRR